MVVVVVEIVVVVVVVVVVVEVVVAVIVVVIVVVVVVVVVVLEVGHRNLSEVRDGDIPRCTNRPSSKIHWTWEYNRGKKPAFTPKIKDKSNTPVYWRA